MKTITYTYLGGVLLHFECPDKAKGMTSTSMTQIDPTFFEVNGTPVCECGEDMTLVKVTRPESNLERFANDVLDTLEDEPDWSADTLDYISNQAVLLGLAEPDSTEFTRINPQQKGNQNEQ